MYLLCLSVVLYPLMVDSANSISVETSPSPYAASSNNLPSYSSPSIQEHQSSAEYKLAGVTPYVHGGGSFPYARQFFEPLFNPSAHYSDSGLSLPRFNLFHHSPSFSSTPYINPTERSPYNLPGYASQPPYSLPGYGNQPLFEPYHPLSFAPQKYARNPYGPDCDLHPIGSALRNQKPSLFYPNKADNYYDSSLPGKRTNPLYNRFQTAFLPPYGGASYPNNVYQ